MRCFTAVLFALVVSGAPHADTIDDIVRAEMERQNVPGLSLAIVRNGRIVKEKGYGVANVEHDVPVSTQTVFQSGSIGKQFTAALAMLLVQDGKLALDEPISKYLPQAPAAWRRITIRHLLTHTSGLPGGDEAIDLQRDYTEDELLLSSYKVALVTAPGEKWAYSNLGYQILGILCSKVGGKFYGDQLRERIFAPLAMHSEVISERKIVPHRAAGYVRVEGELLNQAWVSPSMNSTADGSLYLTAHDLALWSIALEGDAPLSAPLKTAMWTPVRLNDGSKHDYGFGWQLEERGDRRIVRHGGAWQGFTSHIARYPDDGLAVIVLINRARAHPHVFVDKIAGVYVQALQPQPPRKLTASVLRSTPMFLRGTMNGWGTDARLAAAASGVLEAKIVLEPGDHTFRIASEDWTDVDLGAPFDQGRARLDEAKPLEAKGHNITLRVDSKSLYVFRLDARDSDEPTLTASPASSE
jgi:CubicO group peptidase (beta-lactamase class C family)